MDTAPVQRQDVLGSVAALVATFNRREILKPCLTALLEQTRSLQNIIVFDSASTDGTDEMVKQEFPQVTYFRASENIGASGVFCNGLNLGYERGHDWIWLMDDDAIPKRNALREMVQAYESLSPEAQRQAGILCSVKIEHRPMDSPDIFIRELPRSFLEAIRSGFWISRLVDLGDTRLREVDLWGYTGLLIRRDVVTACGTPRAEFFFDGGDFEYCLRVTKQGYKILLVRDSRIKHLLAVSSLKKPLRIFGLWRERVRMPPWRNYYFLRNYIFLARTSIKDIGYGPALGMLLHYLLWAFRLSIGELLYRGPKAAYIILMAAIDGLTGRMGKRVEPR